MARTANKATGRTTKRAGRTATKTAGARKSTGKRTRARAPKPGTPPRGPILTVRQAAELIGMTPGGIYGVIKRGDVPSKRIDGLITVRRADIRAYQRAVIEWMKQNDPNRPLTDEEFIQRLWDSDPD